MPVSRGSPVPGGAREGVRSQPDWQAAAEANTAFACFWAAAPGPAHSQWELQNWRRSDRGACRDRGHRALGGPGELEETWAARLARPPLRMPAPSQAGACARHRAAAASALSTVGVWVILLGTRLQWTSRSPPKTGERESLCPGTSAAETGPPFKWGRPPPPAFSGEALGGETCQLSFLGCVSSWGVLLF